jgi:Cd(II)/Pb(II)-responsive transcriptional regulator
VKIGALSAACGTPVETIRYYEREGLLPAPPRTDGNFRVYGEPHLERLLFIRHCRGLDMSLDEIRVLLQGKDDPSADCGEVNAVLDAHIHHVAQRIKELRSLQRQLKEIRQRCHAAQATPQCGILAGLSEAAQASPKSSAGEQHTHLNSTLRGCR